MGQVSTRQAEQYDYNGDTVQLLLGMLTGICVQGNAIESISVEGQERSGTKWAHIQLEDPQQAVAVKDKLDKYVLAGKMLTAKPAGLHNATQSNMMEAKLNMFWHTGVSLGVGFVHFAVADGTYSGRVVGGKTGLALRFPVRISDLPPDADEITLRDHFQAFGNVASVSMMRKESPSAADDGDFALTLQMLLSMAPETPGCFSIVSQVSTTPCSSHLCCPCDHWTTCKADVT